MRQGIAQMLPKQDKRPVVAILIKLSAEKSCARKVGGRLWLEAAKGRNVVGFDNSCGIGQEDQVASERSSSFEAGHLVELCPNSTCLAESSDVLAEVLADVFGQSLFIRT